MLSWVSVVMSGVTFSQLVFPQTGRLPGIGQVGGPPHEPRVSGVIPMTSRIGRARNVVYEAPMNPHVPVLDVDEVFTVYVAGFATPFEVRSPVNEVSEATQN